MFLSKFIEEARDLLLGNMPNVTKKNFIKSGDAYRLSVYKNGCVYTVSEKQKALWIRLVTLSNIAWLILVFLVALFWELGLMLWLFWEVAVYCFFTFKLEGYECVQGDFSSDISKLRKNYILMTIFLLFLLI